MSVTPEQYQRNLETLQTEIADLILNAPFARSQELLGQILGRVFSKGKDSNNQQIGNYSTTFSVKFEKKTFDRLNKLAQRRVRGSVNKQVNYRQLRINAGRQVAYVDLQFTGELFESIKNGHGDEEGTAIIGFNDIRLAEIGRENEERYNKSIFAPTLEEQAEAKEFMLYFIREGIRTKAKQILNG